MHSSAVFEAKRLRLAPLDTAALQTRGGGGGEPVGGRRRRCIPPGRRDASPACATHAIPETNRPPSIRGADFQAADLGLAAEFNSDEPDTGSPNRCRVAHRIPVTVIAGVATECVRFKPHGLVRFTPVG